jgi:hypothetical protein
LYIGGLINLLIQNNLLFLTYTFKLLFIGANLVNIFLIYKITKNAKAVFLFAANPLVIFELSGNSHTESLTFLFLLMAFYWYKRPILGFAGFIASVLIKYYPLVFLPLFLINLKKRGLSNLLPASIIGLIMIVVMFLPFWQGPDNFSYLMTYYSGHYASHSLLIYPFEWLFSSYLLSFQINTVLFFAIALILLFKFWSGKTDLKKLVFFCFLLYWVYLLTKSSLILSWYLILLILLASLSASWKQYEKYALAGITFTSIYSLLLYYFVR